MNQLDEVAQNIWDALKMGIIELDWLTPEGYEVIRIMLSLGQVKEYYNHENRIIYKRTF